MLESIDNDDPSALVGLPLIRTSRMLRAAGIPSASLCTLADWEAQIAETRVNGYAMDQGNYMAGVTVVAAPVFGVSGELSHCLVVVGISEQLRDQALARIGRELRDGAAQVSRQLGSS